MTHCIADLYSRYPGLILCAIGIFCIVSTVLTFFITEFPDFSDPRTGFTTRNTEISNRYLAYNLLSDEIRNGQFGHPKLERFPDVSGRKKRSNKNASRFERKFHQKKPKYCASAPEDEYVQLVFEIGDFEAGIMDLCVVEQQLWQSGYLSDLESCVSYPKRRKCCQPWHLGSSIAQMSSKSACNTLNSTDITLAWERISGCNSSKNVTIDNWRDGNYENLGKPLPTDECFGFDLAVIFKYLLPASFPKSEKTNYTVFFLPITKSEAVRDASSASPKLFSLQKVKALIDSLGTDNVRLVGMDAGLRFAFFEKYLFYDSMFCVLALIFVVLLMWVYTGTVVYTMAAILSIILSAGLAYFVYRVIFGITFFPFMNLLAFVLLLGVGADDTFILRRTWLCAKKDKNAVTLEKIVSKTLEHACLGMGVTSFTTAAAFFANFASDIIVIKCFGVFAGTAILTHYLLVISWLPAALIIQEKYDRPFHCKSPCDGDCEIAGQGPCKRKLAHFFHLLGGSCRALWVPWKIGYRFCAEMGRTFFEKILPCIVIKFRTIWLLLFAALFAASAYVCFKAPGMRLPEKDYFQLFRSAHPFERFENEFKYRFLYKDEEAPPLDIRLVFGVEPVSDADSLNPDRSGTLRLGSQPDFESNLAVLWLRDLCNELSLANFTLFRPPMLGQCYVPDFMEFMSRTPCEDGNRPCCRDNRFPYPKGVFNLCVARMMQENRDQILGFDTLMNGYTGPFFLPNTSVIGATSVAFWSRFKASMVHSEMREFFQSVEPWVRERLDKAPYMMRNAWFISTTGQALCFYDLQSSLLNGTKIAVPIAVGVAFFFLFICTRNLCIGILSATVIAGIIFATGAALILSGWELNILESTVVCLTVGLSFDFTLHYAVAYSKLCPDPESEARVIFAISRVGSPIFMSCITTMLPGVVMLFSTTLAYSQIGYFMLLISLISYVYATFFFTALLHAFGPSGHNCQLTGEFCSDKFRPKASTHNSSRRVSKAETIIRRPSAPSMLRDGRSGSAAEIRFEPEELEPMTGRRTMSAKKRPSLRERAFASIRRASMPAPSHPRRSSMADRSFVIPRPKESTIRLEEATETVMTCVAEDRESSSLQTLESEN